MNLGGVSFWPVLFCRKFCRRLLTAATANGDEITAVSGSDADLAFFLHQAHTAMVSPYHEYLLLPRADDGTPLSILVCVRDLVHPRWHSVCEHRGILLLARLADAD
jgi:hypothetical protein